MLKSIPDVGQTPSKGVSTLTPKEYRKAACRLGRFDLKEASPLLDTAVSRCEIHDVFAGKGPGIGAVERE